jgi:threonine/homoserine/homoserine lactone efflux protein
VATTGLFAFFTVSLLVIMTPGQDTLLTVRNTLNGGRIAGWLTAVGVAGGQLTWTVAASAGLSAVLLAYPAAFVAIRVAGGVYLIVLGLQSLRAAMGQRAEAVAGLQTRPATRPPTYVRQGLLSNLGNPKMLLFFAGLLPQFAPVGSSMALAMLGLTFCVLTLAWLCVYATAVARLGELFLRPRFWRSIEGATGVGLVALGLRVAVDVPL